jgi:predicted permease
MGLVLLIACASLAGLLLARATARTRELSVRLAIGAGRFRLVRQLFTESLLLALAGGTVGVLAAVWLSRVLPALEPPFPVPISLSAEIDTRALGFSLLLSVATGIIFGLAPAIQASRQDVRQGLKDDAGRSGAPGRSRMRSAFVVAQVALSMLLLIGSGLFICSLRNAHSIDIGFDARNRAPMSVNVQLSGYSEQRGGAFFEQLQDRVRSLPGITSATLASATPLSRFESRRNTFIEGYTSQPGEDLEFHYSVVGADYFSTFRLPLVLGRPFNVADSGSAPGVVIVNETFARRFWPRQNPLGRRLSVTGPRGKLLEVIGVARDAKYITLGENPIPFMYLPALQNYEAALTLGVGSAIDPAATISAMRREIARLDSNLTVTDIKTMEEHLGLSRFPARVAATVLGLFGVTALALAAVGIYGVISFSIGRRTREIGIRMALGATRGSILALVLGQGMALAITGTAIGLAAAFGVTRFIGGFLYGISSLDPVTFAGVPCLLSAVALFAAFLPARRAMRVQPVKALRYE